MKLKQMDLPDNTVQIWHCDFDQNREKLPYYRSLLSKEETAKASRFKFKKDQDCYITTRGILRLLLASYLKLEAKDIIFEYTSFGKPYLAIDGQLKFNVSHSASMAAFAFFNGTELGIDIEKVKNDFDVLELAQNFFSATEIAALESLLEEELPQAFYRCWTRKEAFIKAEGSGLSFPLDKFTVTLDDDIAAELLETQWNPDEKNEWQLFSFVPTEGYLGALAIANTDAKISYRNWDAI